MIDFDSIRKATENNILKYASEIVPKGKVVGREYAMINPTRADNKEGSFSINVDTGLWADFAVDAKGGDVVSLYAYVNSCSQMEAAKAIAGWDGMEIETKKASKKFSPLQPISFPESIKHFKLGEPTLQHKYKYGYVLRFDTKDGKIYLPYNYGIFDGVEGWHWKQIENNRPLYKIETLANSKACVIVEGEKACDALIEAAKGAFKVITWAGGANAIDKTDWTPIYGKGAILWADNDHTGIKAMDAVAKKLIANGCPVKMVNISGMAHKEDAADWVQNHSHEELLQLIRSAAVYEERIEHDDDLMAENPVEEKIREARPIDIDSIIGKRNQAPVVRNDTEKDQPFFALGYSKDRYYIYSRVKGHVIELAPDKINESNLMHILPYRDYWANNFPSKAGANFRDAQEFIMQACLKKDIFDESKIRKRGAWVDNNEIVIHLGDKMYINDTFVKPSDVMSEFIYEKEVPIRIEQVSIVDGKRVEHIPEPLDDETSSKILKLFQSIRFEHPEAALLVAGMTVILPICGVFTHRPHMWISAPPKSGKTDLMNLIIGKLVKSMALKVVPPATESGLRQTISNSTIPVIFDESESETQKSATLMQEVLSLCRRSSSETEATSVMGRSGGSGTQTFSAQSSFLLASIVSTLKTEADKSRFTIISMLSSTSNMAQRHFREVIRPLRDELITPDNCDRFLLRTIKNVKTIMYNTDIFYEAMLDKNIDSRTAKQYAPMLAGAHLYNTTDKITKESAHDIVQKFDFNKFYEPDVMRSEEEDLFMHLLSIQIDVRDDPSANKRTVGWMINHILQSNDESYRIENQIRVMPAASCDELLKERGIRVDLQKEKLLMLIGSKEIDYMVQGNPQWRDWHVLLLRQKDIFRRHKNKAGDYAKVRFGGLKNGYAVECDLDFLRNGVNFNAITPRYMIENLENEPF